MATIQIDLLMLPERLDLTYIDEGKPQRPIAIHRAIYGSLERFIGILIEHFAGAFPLWLAPVQAVVIPIADRMWTPPASSRMFCVGGGYVSRSTPRRTDAVQDPDRPGAEGAVHGRAGRPRPRHARRRHGPEAGNSSHPRTGRPSRIGWLRSPGRGEW